MKKIGGFFKNVINELKKVKWPSKKIMVKYTIVTVVFVVLLSAFFYGITALMAYIKAVI